MTLLVTLFLVLINIFLNITSTSPESESMTSMSLWVITCLLFVFGALFEYACILWVKYNNFKKDLPNDEKIQRILKQTDFIFLIIFPLLFLLFNIFYWWILL